MNRLDIYSRLKHPRKSVDYTGSREKNLEKIRDLLTGQVLTRGSRSILKVEYRIPKEAVYGCVPLGGAFSMDTDLLKVLFPHLNAPVSLNDLLFFDIETTGLSGGAGTYVFMIGFLKVKAEGIRITQYFLNNLSSEHLFLEHIEKFLLSHDLFVTYNGRTFDYNVIKNRFVMGGMGFSKANEVHLDLLYTSRRIWRDMLPDFALSTVEKGVLMLERRGDIPGWRIPEVYAHYLRGRNVSEEILSVFLHNKNDVLSLLALLLKQLALLRQALDYSNHQNPAEKKQGHHHFYPGAGTSGRLQAVSGGIQGTSRMDNDIPRQYNPVSLAEMFLAAGRRDEARALLTVHKEEKEALKSLALLYKKEHAFKKALVHFELLIERRIDITDYLFACTEAAKIYEHVLRDFKKALFYTLKMRTKLERAGYFYPRQIPWHEREKENIDRRYTRLIKKLGKEGSPGLRT